MLFLWGDGCSRRLTAEVVAETVMDQERQGHTGPLYTFGCNKHAFAALGN